MIDYTKMTIKQRIISIIMLTSSITLLLASIAFVLNDRYTARDTMAYIMASEAKMVSGNTAAAMAFGDRQAAQEVLQTLSGQRHIIAAGVYMPDGKPFSRFNKHQSHQHDPLTPGEHPESGYLIGEHTIDFYQPVILDGKTIGMVHISASLQELYANVIGYSSIVLASLIATLALALLLSSRLQHAVTRPIAEITSTAKRISASQDYSLRINKQTDDELGAVIDGINGMLGQIERRDEQLAAHATQLEHEVAERTRELEHITEQFRHQAYHDELTGLPNRALFMERLGYSISQSSRQKQSLALIFLDLDGFKTINDVLGHDVGDELLVDIAQRLTSTIRTSDTVSRFGGDEFTLLLNDISSNEALIKMAEKLLHVVSQPILCGNREVHLSTSMGISMYPQDSESAIDLLKFADTAMYQAKKLGKNTYQFYSPELHSESIGRMSIESELRSALANKELVLHYQPKVDVLKRQITGVEILLRWQHPKKGLLTPSDFIDVAEETGLILPIGKWVLMEACKQAIDWKTSAYSHMNIAVNLSVVQLYQEDLLSTLSTCIEKHRMLPDTLQLELTESMVMNDVGRDRKILNDLRNLGISLAIDDFGTGYSCLNQLRNIPVDTVKIDRSFIRNFDSDERSVAVVKAIIGLAGAMGLYVIAEGVESENEIRRLVKLGCHEIQGFYFSRPVPSNELQATFDSIQSRLQSLDF